MENVTVINQSKYVFLDFFILFWLIFLLCEFRNYKPIAVAVHKVGQ